MMQDERLRRALLFIKRMNWVSTLAREVSLIDIIDVNEHLVPNIAESNLDTPLCPFDCDCCTFSLTFDSTVILIEADTWNSRLLNVHFCRTLNQELMGFIDRAFQRELDNVNLRYYDAQGIIPSSYTLT